MYMFHLIQLVLPQYQKENYLIIKFWIPRKTEKESLNGELARMRSEFAKKDLRSAIGAIHLIKFGLSCHFVVTVAYIEKNEDILSVDCIESVKNWQAAVNHLNKLKVFRSKKIVAT